MSLELQLKDMIAAQGEFNARYGKAIDALQKQVDAIDQKMQRPMGGGSSEGFSVEGIVRQIVEADGFKSLQESGRGRLIVQVKNLLPIETKATITSGSLVPYQHLSGIAPSGRKLYGLVRQLMRSFPITTGSAHFLRELTFTDAASPQGAEGDAKAESTATFEAATAPVRTIAHWTAASKQILDDLVEMGEHIRTSLLFGLDRELEEQILSGSGTGADFDGLITNATAFDSTLLNDVAAGGYNRADVLRASILQLAEAGHNCSGFVVSPHDWFLLEVSKDANRNYLVGDPRRTLDEILWSRPIVPSPAIASGTFLAGDFADMAHLRVRMESTIDISDQHSDFFVRNLIAIRGEIRAALVVKQAAAFVTGTFITSPASS